MDKSKAAELKQRTKRIAIRIIHLYRQLPRTAEAQIIGKQLLRSATSVAANYRSCCRARSKAEFVSRIGIVIEEADESVFWLELLVDTEIVTGKRLAPLITELNQVTAIFVASQRTAAGERSRSN